MYKSCIVFSSFFLYLKRLKISHFLYEISYFQGSENRFPY
nr:MAG TPA: hypothetical protein [Caudoviricetes sp.]DAP68753.1 MAG TPA: hypothetical protein [Caudoviricetes sp.]DAQ55916.1 MAG TPA: hypothetical protein [Caudoviricetes sp.]DAW71348.1 MAG TPA: hypothetical protein [Caudoviricetes sp.]